MTAELTLVAIFERETEAHLGRITLEAEDVECFIFDEPTSHHFGGVKLWVREADLERAKHILDEKKVPRRSS